MTPRRLILRAERRHLNSVTPLLRAVHQTRVRHGFEALLADGPALDAGPRDVLGYSWTTADLVWGPAELQAWLRRRDRPLLLAGGAHPSADPQGALALGFDAVVAGEAERSLPRLLEAIAGGARPLAEVVRPDRPVDLDALEPEGSDRLSFIELSRGCPHRCGFCQVPALFGRRMRHRSPEAVGRWIAAGVAVGFKRFRFLTSDAFAYRDTGGGGARALGAMLSAAQAAGANQLMLGCFPSEVRPDRVRADRLLALRQGCFNRTLVIGAQSGSDRVLALMQRGHSVEQARRAVADTAQHGLRPHVDLLFCFPGEGPEEARDTLELGRWCAREARARLHAHVYLPLPGSPAWPAPAEPLPADVVRGLQQLEQAGVLDGYWQQHIGLGRKILRWRRQGLIQV